MHFAFKEIKSLKPETLNLSTRIAACPPKRHIAGPAGRARSRRYGVDRNCRGEDQALKGRSICSEVTRGTDPQRRSGFDQTAPRRTDGVARAGLERPQTIVHHHTRHPRRAPRPPYSTLDGIVLAGISPIAVADNRSRCAGSVSSAAQTAGGVLSDMAIALAPAFGVGAGSATSIPGSQVRAGALWDHLIYAYMIEKTRVLRDLPPRGARVPARREARRSRLGRQQLWLRSTEELFYSDPPPFSITNVSSQIRTDLRSSRRNAYQRMFGHGAEPRRG
jgi:hypothetical protein